MAIIWTANLASDGCIVTSMTATKIGVKLQADFDVRWCKGPVVERLFKPLTAKIESMGGQILSGRKVSQVTMLGHSSGARYAPPGPTQ